jgi:hypothetical protein
MDLVALYASGLSCREVGELAGLSAEQVARRLKRAGVTFRPKSYRKPKMPPTWDEYFSPRTEHGGDCILWTGGLDGAGYGIINVWFARHHTRAHRVSYMLAYGDFDPKFKVLHRCDVRNCVNPEHLWIGTQIDNIADMVAKGRQRSGGARGEDNHYAKLTEDEVLRMRTMRGLRLSYQKIARHFGVSTMTAYRACVGQAWAHLEGACND